MAPEAQAASVLFTGVAPRLQKTSIVWQVCTLAFPPLLLCSHVFVSGPAVVRQQSAVSTHACGAPSGDRQKHMPCGGLCGALWLVLPGGVIGPAVSCMAMAMHDKWVGWKWNCMAVCQPNSNKCGTALGGYLNPGECCSAGCGTAQSNQLGPCAHAYCTCPCIEGAMTCPGRLLTAGNPLPFPGQVLLPDSRLNRTAPLPLCICRPWTQHSLTCGPSLPCCKAWPGGLCQGCPSAARHGGAGLSRLADWWTATSGKENCPLCSPAVLFTLTCCCCLA